MTNIIFYKNKGIHPTATRSPKDTKLPTGQVARCSDKTGATCSVPNVFWYRDSRTHTACPPRQKQWGASIVEVAIAVALVVVVFLGLITAYNTFVKVTRRNTEVIKATFLLEEGVDALRTVRDNGWGVIDGLGDGTTYHLRFDEVASAWFVTTVPEYIDGFERSFVLESVDRDGNDDISDSGTPDDGTRQVTVSVSWNTDGATTTRSVSGYITKLLES